MNERCSFAMSGTYGHECEKPATLIATFDSTVHPGEPYETGRCDECARIKGGENRGMLSIRFLHKEVSNMSSADDILLIHQLKSIHGIP